MLGEKNRYSRRFERNNGNDKRLLLSVIQHNSIAFVIASAALNIRARTRRAADYVYDSLKVTVPVER